MIDLFTSLTKLTKKGSMLALGLWPRPLDELACRAYHRDPGPFDEAWSSFAKPVRKGWRAVLRRAGKLEREDVPADALKEVVVLDRFHDIATVRLTASWGVDYMMLARSAGRWKIVQVLYQSNPKD